jgi:prepilin-type N-terminal cleavage/methylation domain-containing protein
MNKHGFTLIEVLVAVLIAAFLLSAVWFSYLQGSFNVNSARHTAQAFNLCEAQVETMQSKTQLELQAMCGTETAEEVALDYSDDQSSAITCTRTTTVTDSDSDGVYEVTVTVDWVERYLGASKSRQVTLNTRIADLLM